MERMVLIGNLEHASQVCCWLQYCYVVLRHLINMLLKRAIIVSLSLPLYHKFKQAIQTSSSTDEKYLIEFFSQKKLAYRMYTSKDTMFITVELCQELSFLTHTLNNPQTFRFYTPIAHMVKRIPAYRSWIDASISTAGSYSSNLHFWWFLKWPKCITD